MNRNINSLIIKMKLKILKKLKSNDAECYRIDKIIYFNLIEKFTIISIKKQKIENYYYAKCLFPRRIF